MNSKIVLTNLPSKHDDERIQVLLAREACGKTTISLVQQSWAKGVGWYTQNALDLSSDQVRYLRGVLGSGATLAGASALNVDADTRRFQTGDYPDEKAVVLAFHSLPSRAESA